ncbi:hypothetical protein Nepgr_014797 [Nepenthes gracilis]|uniref:Uncharacterized protein n=1 Tax=Nepenthes gracilis TaxID=150966 RepID=A0AAD3SMI0_NEPGR|nr:hypothetical protein Nepgr_014797 [Nepenthes gracilis]
MERMDYARVCEEIAERPRGYRKHPSGVYRHKSKIRVNPKPISSGSSIGSKGPVPGELQIPTPPPLSNSFGALQDVENDGPFVEKEMGREGNYVGVALGSDKEDRSPLPQNGTVIHTTMVMEPLGDKFSLNGCPASVSDVSDGVSGNPVSPSDQNAQRNTPSIQDRLSVLSPLEGEISECSQCFEDRDRTKVDQDPTHSPVQPLHFLAPAGQDGVALGFARLQCIAVGPAILCPNAAPFAVPKGPCRLIRLLKPGDAAPFRLSSLCWSRLLTEMILFLVQR